MKINEQPAPFMEKEDAYISAKFALLKLRLVHKTSSVLSMMIFHFLCITVFSFFVFALNVTLGLLLGEWLGEYFRGFALVAVFYGVVCAIMFVFRKRIRAFIYRKVFGNIRR